MIAPLVVLVALAGLIAFASRWIGESLALRPHDEMARSVPASGERDPGEEAEDVAIQDAEAPDASWRYDRRGDETYRCTPPPELDIPASEGCADGGVYPRCRWQVPLGRMPDDLYETWRNTTPDHRWGRPGLVSLILAAAADYARRWPGEHLTVGDLDAPGPRHQTHDRGVDVDLYLTHAMMASNVGGGRYPDNYEDKSRREVRALRARVLDLAKILATCTNGQIRIYYNDPDIVRPFRAWFEERGYVSEVGRPMRPHNDLHRFHFHLTVADDLAPL